MSYDKSGVALVLKNSGKSGYELRIYNTKGKQILSKDFEGEYGNIKMTRNQIVLYDGDKCMISIDLEFVNLKERWRQIL